MEVEYPLLPLEEVDMNQSDVVDDLSKYNLFLLRSIYDAFDEKADRVFQSFRKKLFNKMLRPKMLVLKEGPYPPRKRPHKRQTLLVSAEEEQSESLYVEVKPEARQGDGQILLQRNAPDQLEGDSFSLIRSFLKIQNQSGEDLRENVIRIEGRQRYGFVPVAKKEDVRELSVHSHHTSEVLDQEKVEFVDVEAQQRHERFHSPERSESEERVASLGKSVDKTRRRRSKRLSGDMVYYHKEDLTNYSRFLGLNVTKKKQLNRLPS